MGVIGTFLLLCFVVPFLWGLLKGLVGALFELLLDLVSEFGIFYLIFFIGFLDWQNKYNDSWRIRPIMVLNPRSYFFKRTDGGSRHS